MKRYVRPMSEIRKVAQEKWRLYKEATKRSKDPIYKDMKKVYNQLKGGRKVIDINSVFEKSGINSLLQPKLAIARIALKEIYFHYHRSGRLRFSHSSWDGSSQSGDVLMNGVLPNQTEESFGKYTHSKTGKAPVPLVPPQFLPKRITNDLYVLWEVKEWEMVPPKDPYLLKRITKNMFVVLAAWDLTELERAVMKGRM